MFKVFNRDNVIQPELGVGGGPSTAADKRQDVSNAGVSNEVVRLFEHESLANIDEAALIERLTSDSHWRGRIFGIKGIDSACHWFLRVPMTRLPASPRGDVDMLLVAPFRPDQATAIEVKRIKVHDSEANKLQEFHKGVRQANILARIGFHQVYLYVMVVVDSRAKNDDRVSYDDGISPELRSRIFQLFSPSDLHHDVGLIRQDFVQSMDHEPLSVGGYACHLVRLAKPRTQPQELTAWVVDLVR